MSQQPRQRCADPLSLPRLSSRWRPDETRYRFVEAEKGRYPVTRLCRMAQVSRAAYYQWQEGRGSAREAADAALLAAIRAIHTASCGQMKRDGVHSACA